MSIPTENITPEDDTNDSSSHSDLTLNDFEAAYGERFADTIDVDQWEPGQNLAELYAKLQEEILAAVKDETIICSTVRKELFPKIEALKKVPNAGLHRFDESIIQKGHSGFLFNGAVEACNGYSLIHDTLPISITQLGVCLVSYHGQQGSFVHRLFRRDLKLKGEDPVQEALEMIRKRSNREAIGIDDKRMALSELASRGVMAYMERAILMEKSKANWRMGRGNPVPYELMTGFWASRAEMADNVLNLMRRLVDHGKFVYVPSRTKKRDLLTLGNALLPLEYLIIDSLESDLKHMVENGGYRDKIRKKFEQFVEEVGPQIVVGLYRISRAAPPILFYAHINHVQTAALIAMADSILQFPKSNPMLLDIADHLCKSSFGQTDFHSTIQQAYAASGSPTQYLSQRQMK